MAHLYGRNYPPGTPVPIELAPVPIEGTLTVRWINEPLWLPTHYTRTGSEYCTGDNTCPRSLHRDRVIWKGYCCAEYWRENPYRDWIPCVFEVTPRLWELLELEPMRGKMWELKRVGNSRGKKEAHGIKIGEVNPDCLSRPFPILPVLTAVYGRSTFELVAKCPVSSRTFVQPVTGQDPPNAQPVDAPSESVPRPVPLRAFVAELKNSGKPNGRSASL